MTLDTIMVIIAVTAMFATLAFVLGWPTATPTGRRRRTELSADAKRLICLRMIFSENGCTLFRIMR
jgi:hypothetical protein